MTKTYIVAAKRTAIGKFLGTTLSMTAADLGAAVIKNKPESTPPILMK